MILPENNKFVISDYLGLLVQTKERNKYICPVCQGNNLSIAKDGLKFSCFDGCQSLQIAYQLRKLNKEFNKGTDNKVQTTRKPRQETNTSTDSDCMDATKLSSSISVLAFLRDKYQTGRIAYNIRTQEVEIDDQAQSFDCIRAMIGDKFKRDISGDILRECVLYIARQNQYDPVKRYLERCKNAPSISINNILKDVFGIENELYNAYLKHWLIGCVARVFDAGCKFDETLILQGKQGLGKSSFFRLLANSGEYFSDSMTGKLDKDDLMIMGRNWINEWGELDGFSAKTYHGNIKHFLSKQEDTYRAPYSKDTQRIPRRSVIVGTTNRDDFLNDPSGNRRFWIIPVGTSLDIDGFKGMVDLIWSGAISEYEKGTTWHLPSIYWEDQAKDNKNYEQDDPWEFAIKDYLEMEMAIGTGITVMQLLQKLEDLGYSHQYSKRDEMRMADILNKKGWTKKLIRRGEKVFKGWMPPVLLGEEF